ncbi:MAG: hypothetical protein QOC96_1631 [Acidobacteriota bacterium]|jgi:hypothetical protein|nr:hypothetical protein [Acidobacteriota bacterium]
MGIKERIKAKASTRTSDAAKQSLLPSRPFSETKPRVSPPGKPQAPDSEAKHKRAEAKGFRFGDVRVLAGRLKSGAMGRSLPEIIRRKMEAAFQTDFSAVRVHADGKAESIGANAFTKGNEIHFARGKYQPGSGSGQALIGHELTHVVQQRTGQTLAPQGQGTPINRDRALEAEADAQGHRAAMGKVVTARGAGLNAVSHAVVGGGRVVQCQDSEDEDDPSFVMPEPKGKKRKADPQAEIKTGTKKTSTDPVSKKKKLSYETVGGIKHEETFDPSTNSSTVVTSGLGYGGGFRNKTIREKPLVFNKYGLSPGQSGRNQPVIGHKSPSWMGMPAGGQFSNYDLTSPVYNSKVEKKEKKWRDDVSTTTDKFSYQTETQTEPLVDDDRIKEIAKETKKANPKWDEKRIKQRLERVKKKKPELQRVASQKRVLTNERTKKKKTSGELGTDLFLGLPARAYDPNAHKEYKDARRKKFKGKRTSDSEGSDEELEEIKRKKKK